MAAVRRIASASVVADPGAPGDRPAGRGRSCSESSIRRPLGPSARTISSVSASASDFDVGRRQAVVDGARGLAGDDPVLDVDELEDARAVGQLDGQGGDAVVAGPGRRVLEGDRVADPVGEAGERRAVSTCAERSARAEGGPEIAGARASRSAWTRDDVADPVVAEVELAGVRRPVDRHRSGRSRGRAGSRPSGTTRVRDGTRAACPGRSSPCRGRGGRHRAG